MRFFLNFVKEVMIFLVLILIMFFAWFFISNTFLNKNLHITKKENKEVVEKPVKKEDEVVVVNKPVKKEEKVVVVNKPVKKEEKVVVVNKPVKKVKRKIYRKVNKPMKKVKRKIYRKVKKTRKSNWAREQFERYSRGEESIFTPQN